MVLSSRLALAGTRVVSVCTPDVALYPVLGGLVSLLVGAGHAASVRAVTALLWALLMSQSLHVADLARALPDPRALGARQSMRRVRRVLGRGQLISETLSRVLIGFGLRLVRDELVTLVLDSTRCLRWEIFTLGVVYHGRVLPVAWSILAYPWPKKQFTPTVVGLIDRVLRYWPGVRAVHLDADRGFPSLKLFRCLEGWRVRLPLGYTIRLRAGDWVCLKDGRIVKIATLLQEGELDVWRSWPAAYRHRGKAGPLALLVIGKSQPVYPEHQRGPADVARRLARQHRRRGHLLSKGQPNAPITDGAWVLLSTAPTIDAARQAYGLRFRTEGTYRDLKVWGLEEVAAHETDLAHLDGLMGLACLAYLVQAAIGAMASCASSPQAQARQRQWCTTDRLSVFWRGRQVLHDRAHDWHPWLRASITDLANPTAPSTSPPTPTFAIASEAA